MKLLIWKNIIGRKGQTMVTLLTAGTALFLFTVILGVLTLIQTGLYTAKERCGADILIQSEEVRLSDRGMLFSGEPVNSYLPASMAEELKEMDEVEEVSTQFYAHTLQDSCCSTEQAVRLVGIEDETDFTIKPWLQQHGMSTLKKNQVIVGSKIPKQLGNVMTVVTRKYEIVGTLAETGTSVDETVFLRMDEARDLAQNIYDLMPLWETIDPEETVSAILIRTKQGESPKEVGDKIAQRYSGIKVAVPSGILEDYLNGIYWFKRVLFVMGLLLFFITGISFFGRFADIVQIRKKEIGLLRTMGVTAKEIFFSLLMEYTCSILLGGSMGCLIGALCIPKCMKLLENQMILPSVTYDLPFYLLLIGIGLAAALVLGILSALLPSWLALKMETQKVITSSDL